MTWSCSSAARNGCIGRLKTSREAKYKAKQVVDTFVMRFGDSLSAGVVFFGSRAALSSRAFLGINVCLSIAWTVVAIVLGREYARRQEPALEQPHG